MSYEPQQPTGPVARVIQHELQHLRDEWWWFLVLGILLIVSGTVALFYPFLASVAAVMVLGVSPLVSGAATIVAAFWAGKKWSALLLQLLVGIFYAVTGFLIMDAPIASTVSLTLVIATMFIIIGIMRSVAALVIRFPQWGWSLLSGVLATLIGIVIYKNLTETALWAIGTLVGIQLLFDGWFWVMLSLAVRRLPVSRP